MRLITLLFTLLFWFNAVAVAPYGIKGQSQSGTLYSNVHQFPNNQVTNMGGINALVETGNKNILVNPSFEHSTFSTGWTSGAGSFSQNLTVEIDGLKAAEVTLSAQALAITQDSTLYASQFADGVQGLASIRVKTSLSGIKVCSRQAGVTSTTNCVNVQANGKWGLYKVPMILGATSNGISIHSNGTSLTGTVYLDDAFVGAVDLQATVDSSRVAGEAYFAGTTSCSWSRTSTSLGSFNTNANCPGPTIAYSSLGQWQTTDSDLPRVTINNLPAGVYKAKFLLITSQITGGFPSLTINDGTTSCSAQAGTTDTAFGNQTVVECTFVYNQSGNRSFEVYGASSSNTVSIFNSVTLPGSSGSKFILEYFGSGSVYSSTNADTDWNNISNVSAGTFITATTTNPAYGTVATNKAQWKRQGSDLLLRWDYRQTTAGTAGSGQYLINIPAETGCVIDTTKAPTSTFASPLAAGKNSNVGTFYYGDLSNDGLGQVFPFSTTQLGVAFIYVGASSNRGYWGSTTGAMNVTPQNLGIDARIPCANWQNSNIIIGQFNGLESCTNTLECTDTFSAKISSAGVVSDENMNWINGNCTNSAGLGTCTFNTSIFSVTPNCSVTYDGAGNTFAGRTASVRSASSTQILYITEAGSVTAAPVNLICQKQGVDYVGKTAKAVASDQNVRTPGATKVVNFSLSYGTTNLSTPCSASPCLIDQVGSVVSSVTRTSTGSYTVNFVNSMDKVHCAYGSGTSSAGDAIISYGLSSCSSSCSNITFSTRQASSVGTLRDSYGSIVCTGVQQ